MESELDAVTTRLYLLNEPQRELNETRSGLIKLNSECRIIPNPEEFVSQLESEKYRIIIKDEKILSAWFSYDTSIEILISDIVRYLQLENAD